MLIYLLLFFITAALLWEIKECRRRIAALEDEVDELSLRVPAPPPPPKRPADKVIAAVTKPAK